MLRACFKTRFGVEQATGVFRWATSPPGASAASCRRRPAGSPFHPLFKQAIRLSPRPAFSGKEILCEASRTPAFCRKCTGFLESSVGLHPMSFPQPMANFMTVKDSNLQYAPAWRQLVAAFLRGLRAARSLRSPAEVSSRHQTAQFNPYLDGIKADSANDLAGVKHGFQRAGLRPAIPLA